MAHGAIGLMERAKRKRRGGRHGATPPRLPAGRAERRMWVGRGVGGWRLVIAVAAGIVAITGAIEGVRSLLPSSRSGEAKIVDASITPDLTWKQFGARDSFASDRRPRRAPRLILVSATITSGTAASSTPAVTGTGSTPATTTGVTGTGTTSGTTATNADTGTSTATSTTGTGTGGAVTSTTGGSAGSAAVAATATMPVDPRRGQHPLASPPHLTRRQRHTLHRLAGRARRSVQLPAGCDASLTARSCPAGVDAGLLPGPVGAPQATVDRYAYTDQTTVLRGLLQTLPKIRYVTSGGRRTPLGVEVDVTVDVSGSLARPLLLVWTVAQTGSQVGLALGWCKSRIANEITSTTSQRFWIPIPRTLRQYLLQLQLEDPRTGTAVGPLITARPSF